MNLKSIGKFTVVGVLLVSAAVVMAQGGGGGGQGRGGRGGGRFGFAAGPAQLAARPDVQRDIAATDDQKTKIAALQDKLNEDRRAMFQELISGGQPDQDVMRKAMEKFNAKTKEDLAKILNGDQMKRIDEIGIQLQGNRAILSTAVQKALGLTPETIKKIEGLQQGQQDAGRAMFEKVQNQEITREEMMAATEKNNKILDEELGKLLSADEAAKLKGMAGKPFKADPPSSGGG